MRSGVRRTVYDLYSLYFLPEMRVKFMKWNRGHLVMLIEIGLHALMCTSAHSLVLIWWG